MKSESCQRHQYLLGLVSFGLRRLKYDAFTALRSIKPGIVYVDVIQHNVTGVDN